MPPAASGNGAPKKNAHVPLPHGVLSSHLIAGLLLQRWALISPLSAFRFWIGPLTLHTPHGRVVPPQATSKVSLPSETTVALCARPVQPLSSTLLFPALPTTSTATGQGR